MIKTIWCQFKVAHLQSLTRKISGLDMKIVILRDLKAKIFLIIRFCVNLKIKMAAMPLFAKVAPIKNEQVTG